MSEIRLEIPGRPVPWQRVRTNQGRFFTPKETRDYEEAVAWVCKTTREKIGDAPCAIEIDLYRDRAVVYIRPLPEGEKRALKGDIDNYAKAILDGLQKGGILKDDKQVSELHLAFPSD